MEIHTYTLLNMKMKVKRQTAQKKYAYVGLELDKETAQKLVAKNSTLPDNPEIMAVTLVDSSRNKGAIKKLR